MKTGMMMFRWPRSVMSIHRRKTDNNNSSNKNNHSSSNSNKNIVKKGKAAAKRTNSRNRTLVMEEIGMNLRRNELKAVKSTEVVALLFSMKRIPESNINSSSNNNNLLSRSSSHRNNSRNL